jgi:hypothetical protein
MHTGMAPAPSKTQMFQSGVGMNSSWGLGVTSPTQPRLRPGQALSASPPTSTARSGAARRFPHQTPLKVGRQPPAVMANPLAQTLLAAAD